MFKKILLLSTLLVSVAIVHAENIVEFVVNSPDHEILEDAVILAGLDDDLSADGPTPLFYFVKSFTQNPGPLCYNAMHINFLLFTYFRIYFLHIAWLAWPS